MSTFPASLDSLTVPSGGAYLGTSTPSHSAVHQAEQSAIMAIEATLGLNPQGASATVAARLASLASATTDASNLTSGTLADARLSANVVKSTAGALPALTAALLTALNASALASGTVADARLSANVALLNGSAAFTTDQTISATLSVSGGASKVTGTTGVPSQAANAHFQVADGWRVIRAGAAANSRNWDMTVTDSGLSMRLVNDAYNSAAPWMVVVRTGPLTSNVSIKGATLYESGGVYVGNTPVDPGVNNLQIQGVCSVDASVVVGSTANRTTITGTYFEIGAGNTNLSTYIDFHSAEASIPGQDYSARIIREGGIDGTLGLSNTGTGPIAFDVPGSRVITIFSSAGVSIGQVPADPGPNNLQVQGSILSRGTSGIGYSAGAGGTATQLTSKATGVTLSKACGTITLNAASLAANTGVSFTLTNTAIAADDIVHVQHNSVGTLGAYGITATPAAGSATITVRNLTAGALAEAIVLRFVIIKAVTA